MKKEKKMKKDYKRRQQQTAQKQRNISPIPHAAQIYYQLVDDYQYQCQLTTTAFVIFTLFYHQQ